MISQPLPSREERSRDVIPVAVAYLHQRAATGIETYGTTLKTFNGRSAARDALEEAADLFVYLMQYRMESAEHFDAGRRWVMDVLKRKQKVIHAQDKAIGKACSLLIECLEAEAIREFQAITETPAP